MLSSVQQLDKFYICLFIFTASVCKYVDYDIYNEK